MPSSIRLDDLQQKYAENPRRYFAPLANELRKAGDPRAAVALCREHLAQQPGHLSGHVVLAQAHFDLGELDEARRIFDEALELDPENVVALRYLGDIARHGGAPDDARQWYQRILELDPRNPDAHARLETLAQEARPAAPAALDALDAPAMPEAPVAPAFVPPPAASLHEYTPMVADAASLAPQADVDDTRAFDEMLASLPGSQPEQGAASLDGEGEAAPWGEPAFVRAVDASDGFAAAPADPGDPDELLRELEGQFGAEEFTAGFFAEVLDPSSLGGAADVEEGALAAAAEESVAEMPLAHAAEPFDDEPPLFAGDAPTEVVGVAPPGDEESVDAGYAEARPPETRFDEEHVSQARAVEEAHVATSGGEALVAAEMLAMAELAPEGSMGSMDAERSAPEIDAGGPIEAPAEQPGVAPSADVAAGAEGWPRPDVVTDEVVVESEAPVFAEAAAEPAASWEAAAVGEQVADATLVDDGLTEPPRDEQSPAQPWERQAGAELPGAELPGEAQFADALSTEGRLTDEVPTLAELDAWGVDAPMVGVDGTSEPSAPADFAPDEARSPGDAPAPSPAAAAAGPLEADWFADTVEYPAPVSEASHVDLASDAAAAIHSDDEPQAEPPAVQAPAAAEAEPVVDGAVLEPPAASPGLEPVAAAVRADEPAAPMAPPDAFATATMAELYERQGLHERALGIYRQLLARDPSDPELEAQATRLERLLSGVPDESPAGVPAAAVAEQGSPLPPTVGGWLRALVTTPVPRRERPVEGAAAPVHEPEAPAAAPVPAAQPPAAPAPSAWGDPRPTLSLDELLGRPVAPAEEHAAGALVAATLSLQSDAAVDAQLAELTQDDPSSIERVLREPTPPSPAASLRQGVSFSFDQFFRQAPDAESASPGGAPTAASPAGPAGAAPAAPSPADDDLEDFHAWLAGLSKS